jgi:hypothetical protein
MRVHLFVLTLLVLPAAVTRAGAQTADARRVELGATAATACLTTSSYCGGGREGMYGLYASYWLTPRVEIGGRVARLPRPDVSGTTYYYLGPANEEVTITQTSRDRSRTYMLGHIYRHFGPDPRVRLYAGLALGLQDDRSSVSCDATDCQAGLDKVGLTVETGRLSNRRGNVAVGLGLSGHAASFGWRAGVNLHNFPGENIGATEYFASGALRF